MMRLVPEQAMQHSNMPIKLIKLKKSENWKARKVGGGKVRIWYQDYVEDSPIITK